MTLEELQELKEKEIREKYEKYLETPSSYAGTFSYITFKAGYLANEDPTGNQSTFYLKENNPFLAKVHPNEPIFILRAQDNTAPEIVLDWIAKNIDTVPETRIKEAFQTVLAMRRYDKRRDPT